MNEPIFCLMGPTASGKTALACQLVAQLPLEIISVDSVMVYRDMNIGTAKPSLAERSTTVHHLIDILNPIESYSAAQFCADATLLCQDILQRGKFPLLVGGTMLYFHTFQQGLSLLPTADKDLREKLLVEMQVKGLDSLYFQLCQFDPVRAADIHKSDKQRILRALEVWYSSGQPMSALQAVNKLASSLNFVNIALFPANRAWLHAHIAQRFDEMLNYGLVDETRQLVDKWQLTADSSPMRAVGYRQVMAFLDGAYDEKTLREKGIAATRQLAKRQLTWLRTWKDVLYFDPENPATVEQIMQKITEILRSV